MFGSDAHERPKPAPFTTAMTAAEVWSGDRSFEVAMTMGLVDVRPEGEAPLVRRRDSAESRGGPRRLRCCMRSFTKKRYAAHKHASVERTGRHAARTPKAKVGGMPCLSALGGSGLVPSRKSLGGPGRGIDNTWDGVTLLGCTGEPVQRPVGLLI